MKLSVIIVNYNVKDYLRQCLGSVIKATATIQTEIWVVDNNSVDESVEMIKTDFPMVNLIENKDNKGFSKANNQAIVKATGQYILLLNPDTVVEENTFIQTIAYLDNHPQAGALGVKLIDGNGRYLPESKRGLPNPETAFYKIFGLTYLFPKSKKFARYYLGHLQYNNIHEIEVLPGAFMLLRKSVLDITGNLDEDFFMYGEDIDLSYRIIKSGFKIIYFPHTTIIHYKGKSTAKASINYVKMFYNAMIIFARKHYSGKKFKTFGYIINFAIYFRAFISICNNAFKKSILPVADILFFTLFFYLFSNYWYIIKFNAIGTYPNAIIKVLFPMYVFIVIVSNLFLGLYAKNCRLQNIIKSSVYSTVFIVLLYSLLPESYRFSRLLTVSGGVLAFLTFLFNRLFLTIFFPQIHTLITNKNKKTVIVATKNDYIRICEFYSIPLSEKSQLRFLEYSPDLLQSKLSEIIKINKPDEIVFSGTSLSSEQIIRTISLFNKLNITFKVVFSDSMVFIGNNGIENMNQIISIPVNRIDIFPAKFIKRCFDVFFSLMILTFFPIWSLMVKNKKNLFVNLVNVLTGKYTFVGYSACTNIGNLPELKQSILSITELVKNKVVTNDMINKINLNYANNYSVKTDLLLLFTAFKQLDKTKHQ